MENPIKMDDFGGTTIFGIRKHPHGVEKIQTTQIISMWISASRSDHQEAAAANCYFSTVSDAVRRIMKFSFRRNVCHHPMYTSNQAKMHW